MAVPDLLMSAVLDRMNGSVIAPAGYGKTETIADIVAASSGRCLILTHTLAGVDALKKRLRDKGVKSDRFQLDTIAAWSLPYASSYPVTSGFPRTTTPRGNQWHSVYTAARQLLDSRTVDIVIRASYALALVDEYQDCSLEQHEIVKSLSRTVPTLVFGDPLQAIFDFGAEKPVKWVEDVLPAFPQVDELKTPWRWKNKHNEPLAEWLKIVRENLLSGNAINLLELPSCIRVYHLQNSSQTLSLERKACNRTTPSASNRVVIIGAKGSEGQRAALAKRVRAQNVESIECKELLSACVKIESSSGLERLGILVQLLNKCVVGVKPTPFLRRIKEIQNGKLTPRQLTISEAAALQLVNGASLEPLITLIDEFRKAGRSYRSELIFALRDSLQSRCLPGSPSLLECAWHVQERRRNAGRSHGHKIVASTLLVKGLEYENAVVFLANPMTKEDIYVALTRAALRIEIITDRLELQPVR